MRGAPPVSPVNSYAVRRDDRVEVVLADPVAPLDAGDATVVLRRGDRRVRAPASLVDDTRGRRLVATFPAAGLTDGEYRLVLRAGGTRMKPGVRLVVQGDLPLVLRWGDRVSTVREQVS